MGRKLCKKASRGIARKIEPAVVAGFPIIMYTLCFEAEKHVTTSIPPPPPPLFPSPYFHRCCYLPNSESLLITGISKHWRPHCSIKPSLTTTHSFAMPVLGRINFLQ